MIHTERVPKSFCTTREAAQLLGVSLRTVQLWTESGLLDAWKTDGGHRRVSRESIERLVASPSRAPGPGAPSAVDNGRGQPGAGTGDEDDSISIMVVDDEIALRKLYVATMGRWALPVRVSVAGDGYEALIRIGREAPDLLIADLHMTGVDGFRMLRTIRMSPELEQLAIVVVTGLDGQAILSRGGLPAGIPVLSKPIPFDSLQQIAERVATERKAARAARVR